MTRRQILLGGLCAGAVRAGAGPAPSSASARFRVGCGTVTFRKCSLDEALQRIVRAGYEYCETQATGPWCPHVDVWKDDPDKFRRRVADIGFKGVTGLWSPNGAIISNPKSVEGITQAIRWASAAGIPVVHAGDGKRAAGTSDDEALKILADRLAEILEVAESQRVYLGIEPHGTYSVTEEGLKKILSLSGSRWLGINYDTANVHRVMYEKGQPGAYTSPFFGAAHDEVSTLAAVADRVVHVHVKDVVGSKCVPLGKGDVNVKGCLDVLRKRSYAGAISLETEGEMDAETGQAMIEESRRWLTAVLA